MASTPRPQYVDMLSAGIVDPAKVVRVALQTPRRSPA
jgi:chaperonin GroEL (HSP60 family)